METMPGAEGRQYSLALSNAEVARYQLMAERARATEADLWQRAGIVAGAKVADVGCGPGALLPALSACRRPDRARHRDRCRSRGGRGGRRPGRRGRPRQCHHPTRSSRPDGGAGRVLRCGDASPRAGAQRRRRGRDRRAPGDAAAPWRLPVPGRCRRHRDADGARGRRPDGPAAAIPHLPHGPGQRCPRRAAAGRAPGPRGAGTGGLPRHLRDRTRPARDAAATLGCARRDGGRRPGDRARCCRWARALDRFDAAATRPTLLPRCSSRSAAVRPERTRAPLSIGLPHEQPAAKP